MLCYRRAAASWPDAIIRSLLAHSTGCSAMGGWLRVLPFIAAILAALN
jgi:hypothetical protein